MQVPLESSTMNSTLRPTGANPGILRHAGISLDGEQAGVDSGQGGRGGQGLLQAFLGARMAFLMGWLSLVSLSCQGSPVPAWAEWDKTKEVTYVSIILTEATGEPLDGQIAVAEVLRNRHWSTRGFAGIKRTDLRQLLARQTPQAVERAWTAYRRARAGSQLAGGATHFENVEAFGRPAWSRKMKVVAKLGHHTFFKE